MKILHTSFTACLIVIALILMSIGVFAGPGDTTVVQTFTFGSPQNAKFLFPPDSKKFEKALMYYTLKCNPAQNPACGEWDYTTHTYLYDHTGDLDSTQQYQPSFVVNGASPDTFMYMNTPSYKYQTWWEYYIVYDSVSSFDSTIVGSGSTLSAQPFTSSESDAKTQYLWTASELTSNGLTAGDISGIRFELNTAGSELRKLSIRMKYSTLDSLNQDSYEMSGFTEVYSRNTQFSSGWNTLDFTYPFTWDGTSNIVIEICFDNQAMGTDNGILAHNAGFSAGVYSAATEYYLNFNGSDFVDLPASTFTSLTDEVTISFWQYGDPVIQPQSDYIFEGTDTDGYRVLNSHLPWSNGRVYWDAGNNGSTYDRLDKIANDVDYEGQWNHWAFVKNANIGQMRIYLNGSLWMLGGSKSNDMTGIARFKIGSNAPGTNSYDGYIDEFRIWNKELDENTIKDWMYKDIDIAHPFYSNLLAYYQFNEGTGFNTADASPTGNSGILFGAPGWGNLNGCGLMRNMQATSMRPNVIFEQGIYTSHIDSILIEDSVEQAPVALILYQDAQDPTVPTDTTYVWNSYYNNYTYDLNGAATDSSLVSPDNTIYLQQLEYYDVFEVIERYELWRYITPYGIGLDLGAGWTWVYDVSDYMPFLNDSVHLSAGNWQELLDVKFMMIEGIPPRDVIKVENLWKGTYWLNSIDSTVADMTVQLDPTASMYRLKTRTSGHRFDPPSYCAEFCYKIHSVDIDTTMIDSWEIMQLCGMNPLYPQGGTWIYDRAGWCPGMEVTTRDIELTPYVTPGALVAIDYDSPTDPNGNYILRAQLISYSGANFTLDAAVDEIISPNNWEIQSRFNPVCDNPEIVIKNTGSTTLISLDIKFGVKRGVKQTYQWTGSLNFLEKETVFLAALDDCWFLDGNSESTVFEVTVSNPNGGNDEYWANNKAASNFDVPPQYIGQLYLSFKTNSFPNETSYSVEDEQGNAVYQSGFLAANTSYQDTFSLSAGCYRLIINDSDCDGLSFWNNSDGTGFARLYTADGNNTALVFFEPDFGCQIAQSFTVGLPVFTVTTTDATCGSSNGTALATVSDPAGVYSYSWTTGATGSSQLTLPSGIYGVTVTDANGCSHSETVLINDDAGPVTSIALSGDISCNGLCDGTASVVASGASPPYTYSWSDPSNQTSTAVTGLCPGEYTVTVTDNAGCKSFEKVTLKEQEALVSTAYATGETTGCDGSAWVNVMGGVVPYTYAWDDPATQSTYQANNLCGGTYTTTITDANGCTTTADATVVTGIREVAKEVMVNIYPNPGTGLFRIDIYTGTSEKIGVRVLNLLGQPIQQFEMAGNNEMIVADLNLSQYPNGIYFVEVRSGSLSHISKLILQ